jgi:TRAP-type C4-dicarboxylate transport system substrate-binding protein
VIKVLVALWMGMMAAAAAAQELPQTQLRIIGGLGNVSLYLNHERPFWEEHVPRASGGQVTASIAPLEQVGVRPTDVFNVLRRGTVSMATVLLVSLATEDPLMIAPDIAGASPDFATLEATLARWRPFLEARMRDELGVIPLAFMVYPAQIVFCRVPIRSLADLKDRRVRVSGVSQSDFMLGLGAQPVVMPFAQVLASMENRSVDCTTTGSLSGNEIGLARVATHMHDMAISWGILVVLANRSFWTNAPAALRDFLTRELAAFEARTMAATAHETRVGVECNVGTPARECREVGRMAHVRTQADEHSLRVRILRDHVLPGWIDRCGRGCARIWNDHLAPDADPRLRLP